MLFRKAFKFRLESNAGQRQKLFQQAGCVRFVYNQALTKQRECLATGEKLFTYHQLAGQVTLQKKEQQTLWLGEVHSQPLQQALRDLDRALRDGLQKKKGMPHFRAKGKHDTFRYPQGVKLLGNRVFLPKVGWVKFRKSREVEGVIKNTTVSFCCGYWYVSLQTEIQIEAPVHPSQTGVGIDLGVKRFATFSNREYAEPLDSFRTMEERLAREQRRLARKVKGSKNWYKQKRKLARLHKRVADIRRDYLHKLTDELSQNHALIVIEDLKVSNMSRSARGTVENPGTHVGQKSGLNKAILDQGWYEFRRQLTYKMAWRGGELRVVPPEYTSQTCPECGHVDKANRPTQERFCCVNCGHAGHADEVAAQNIWYRGTTR